MTFAIVKVLPEPVTPRSTCVCSPASDMPFTSSSIAPGWSPFGSKSETILRATPPSLFSGRGGRCGTQVLSRNSGRPSSISRESDSTVAVTPDGGSAPASSSITSSPATGIKPAPARSLALARPPIDVPLAVRRGAVFCCFSFSGFKGIDRSERVGSPRPFTRRFGFSFAAPASASRAISSAQVEIDPDSFPAGTPSSFACGASPNPDFLRGGMSRIWGIEHRLAIPPPSPRRDLLTRHVRSGCRVQTSGRTACLS